MDKYFKLFEKKTPLSIYIEIILKLKMSKPI